MTKWKLVITNWKLVAWFVGLLPVAAGLWWLAFEPAYYSQLAMRMKVHLDRPADKTPIRTVWCATGYRLHPILDNLLANTDKVEAREYEDWICKTEPFEGKAFDFRVSGDDCGSMLGITLDYAQHRHLLVVAELADGRRVATIADIPDARTTREMRVVLP